MRITVSFQRMHDLNYFRDHLEVFAEMAKKRGAALDLDAFRKLDKERRELITATEQLKAQRNKASEEIARLKKEKKNADSIIAEMKQVSERIKQSDERIAELDTTQVREAVAALVSEKISGSEKKEFLRALRAKGETAGEIAAFAEGLCRGLAHTLSHGHALYVVLDGDVAQTLGAILREERGVKSDILVIDGIGEACCSTLLSCACGACGPMR